MEPSASLTGSTAGIVLWAMRRNTERGRGLAEVLSEVPALGEDREAVCQRPGGDHTEFGGLAAAAVRQRDDARPQSSTSPLFGGQQFRIVAVVELRPVHHLEVRRMLEGELHVRHADLRKRNGSGGQCLLHRVGQDLVALDRDGGEQTGLVLEVVGGRGVRHTGPAGEVTQADGDGALGGDDLHGGVDDGASEIAVVVTALTGMSTSLPDRPVGAQARGHRPRQKGRIG